MEWRDDVQLSDIGFFDDCPFDRSGLDPERVVSGGQVVVDGARGAAPADGVALVPCDGCRFRM